MVSCKTYIIPLKPDFLFIDARPFSVQKIPHSNLILLVVDTLCPCGSKQLSITPEELVYESRDQNGCTHRPRPILYRKRPPKCINYHPEVSVILRLRFYIDALFYAQEIEIHICGKGTALKSVQFLTLFFCVLICLLSSAPVS